MQGKTRQELYRAFIEFITNDIQLERHQVNRRMLSVFFWCFLLPALLSITLLILIKVRILPSRVRNYLDWIVLVLPVIYSLHFLSSEVLAQIPARFRRGGGAGALQQSLKEGAWREQTCESMEKALTASTEDWDWIIASFEMDLQAMDYRAKYLTALAGAVFFLLMQGIDSLSDTEGKVTWVKSTALGGWVQTSTNDVSQFVGLGLFLILLYLSGSQTYQSFRRYLNCAVLIRKKLD
jgi:hypothetical protein